MELQQLGGRPHAFVVVRYSPADAETFADAVSEMLRIRQDSGVECVQIRQISEPMHPFICGWWRHRATGEWHLRPLDEWYRGIRDWRFDLQDYEQHHRIPGALTTA